MNLQDSSKNSRRNKSQKSRKNNSKNSQGKGFVEGREERQEGPPAIVDIRGNSSEGGLSMSEQ